MNKTKAAAIGFGALAAYFLANGIAIADAKRRLERDRDVWKDRAESQRLTTELLMIDNRALMLKNRRGF